MKFWWAKLYNLWQQTRASLLYVPALFCLGFIASGVGALQVDLHFEQAFADQRLIYNGNLHEAQEIAGVLLGCMVTMVTLVISITMVVLSLSASQLGPRLVRVFMGDRRTKIYFGIFFGSIALCFTVLGILHDPISSDATPRLTVSYVFLVSFLNLFVLLAYVNHVAQSGVADNIVARLSRELRESIDRLAPKRESEEAQVNRSGEGSFVDLFTHTKEPFFSRHSGYVQSIQYESLYQLAQQADAYIQIHCKPGDHVVERESIADVYTAVYGGDSSKVMDTLGEAILIGDYRSATQDIEYSIRHMVEIALRALSPGINDCFTAVSVLDKLSAELAHLFTLSLPVYAFKDSEGKVRLMGNSSSEAALVFTALSEIRNAGQQQLIILQCLIANIGKLKKLATSDSQRSSLELQTEYIELHINEHFAGSPTETILRRWMRECGLRGEEGV